MFKFISGLDNNKLMISVFSLSIAKCNAVL